MMPGSPSQHNLWQGRVSNGLAACVLRVWIPAATAERAAFNGQSVGRSRIPSSRTTSLLRTLQSLHRLPVILLLLRFSGSKGRELFLCLFDLSLLLIEP